MTPATLLTETFMRAQGYARIADPEGLLETVLREGARAAAVRTDAVSFWRAQSSLCALLAIIASATPAGRGDWRISASAPLQDASHLLVSEVDEYLQAHLGESVVLGELARIMGVSTSSLSHRYKSLAGRSPLQALRRLRIERAKTLLLQGYKQDDIAAQCGFYDAAHFSRTFSQLAGQSPRRFVRS
jgi:transcriptional regulator GlxA family with amidase domain